MNWWVYLLLCRDGRTYAGIATDVAARYRAHAGGKGSKFTRANPPVKVLAAQPFATKPEALRAEHALKCLSRPEKLAWASQWEYGPNDQIISSDRERVGGGKA